MNLQENINRIKQVIANSTNQIYLFENKELVTPRQGIIELFEDNLELSSIGTEEQYEKYIKTIFPDSKVNNIVYHRTKSQKFDNFNNKTDNYAKSDTYTKDGIYFSNDMNIGAEVYGETIIPAIVNISNPYLFKEEGIFAIEGDNPYNLSINSIDQKKLLGNEDGVLFKPNKRNGQTIVFEPEQIHILGSKKDIEGFKNFVSNNTKL